MDQIITLSKSNYLLKQSGHLLQASKLKIKSLDQLSPTHTQNLHTLILNHNMLTHLQNIIQFSQLRSLDISFNWIVNCDQLLKLKPLSKLTKLKIIGNPFLIGPFTESTFFFLFQKQLDVQILTGQIRNQMKNLIQFSMQIIFLKNYLHKKYLHHQLHYHQIKPLHNIIITPTQKLPNNRDIIHKIIPYFYPTIEHPKHQTLIKKQASTLKLKQNITLQQALISLTDKQQIQVQKLNQQIQEQLTNSYPPQFDNQIQAKQSSQRSKVQVLSMIIYQEAVGENNSCEQSQSYTSMIPSKLKKKQHLNDQLKTSCPQKPKQSFISPTQRSQLLQIKNQSQYQLSHKQLSSLKNKSLKYLPTLPTANQFKTNQNNNTLLPITKSRHINNQSKLQSNKNKKSHHFRSSESSLNNQKIKQKVDHSISPHPSLIDSLASQFTDQYYSHINPPLHLLNSDQRSLPDHQQSLIYETLVHDTKQKILSLSLQPQKTQILPELLPQPQQPPQAQLTNILIKIQDKPQQSNLLIQHNSQLQQHPITLNQLNKQLAQDRNHFNQSKIQYEKQMKNKNIIIKDLQQNIKQKTQYITYLQKCQQIQQQIHSTSIKNIKIKWLTILKQKLNQFTLIIYFKQKQQKIKSNLLLNCSWSLWKKYHHINQLCKKKIYQYQHQLSSTFFLFWKQHYLKQKQIKINGNALKQILNYGILKSSMNLLITKNSQKKQNLSNITLADNKFISNIFNRFKHKILSLKLQQQSKYLLAKNHNQLFIKYIGFSQIFNQLLSHQSKIKLLSISVFKHQKLSFYYMWKQFYHNHLLKIQQQFKISSLSKLFNFQTQHKQKKKAVKAILQQYSQLSQKIKTLQKLNRYKHLLIFQSIINTKTNIKSNIQKIKYLFIKKQSNIFIQHIQFNQNKVVDLKNICKKYIISISHHQLNIQKKTIYLQSKLKKNYYHKVFYKLLRNLYSQKFLKYKATKPSKLSPSTPSSKTPTPPQLTTPSPSKPFPQKPTKSHHQHQLKKKMQYNKSLLKIKSSNQQLQNIIKLIKQQLSWLKSKQISFYKDKFKIQEQLSEKQQELHQVIALNGDLKQEINSVTSKYDQTMKLYAHALIKMGKKLKNNQKIFTTSPTSKQLKSKIDKTLQKPKKNNHHLITKL